MSLTPYLIPISAAVLLLIVVAVIVLRHVLTPRIIAPLCGCCRYDVTGLPTTTCPECGADLNEVGVLQPGSVKPMGRMMKLSLWTVSVTAVAVIVTPPILRSVPPLNQTTVTHTLGSPGSRLYDTVRIDSIRRWRKDSTSASIDLTLTLTRLDGQTFEMSVIPGKNRCSYLDAGRRRHKAQMLVEDSEQAANAVLAWLDACGIAATGDTLKPEANQIAHAIDEAVNPPAKSRISFGSFTTSTFGSVRSFGSNSVRGVSSIPFSSTAMQMNSGRVADPWPLRIAIGWWALTWILGVGIVLLVAMRQHPADPGVL